MQNRQHYKLLQSRLQLEYNSLYADMTNKMFVYIFFIIQ